MSFNFNSIEAQLEEPDNGMDANNTAYCNQDRLCCDVVDSFCHKNMKLNRKAPARWRRQAQNGGVGKGKEFINAI